MNQIVLLPNGDQWCSPTFDQAGAIVPRPDNVSLAQLPKREALSPEMAARILHQAEEARAEAQALVNAATATTE